MYFLLQKNSFQKPEAYRTTSLIEDDGFEPSDWITGRMMKMPGFPMRIELWERGGNGMSEIFLDSIPLFREDLIAALEAAGVDNLQTAPAELRLPDGTIVRDYRAVNIIGAVACADMRRSQYDDITGTGMIAVGFRKLVIDEEAAAGRLFFRLGQAVASIIVHEGVKGALETRNFQYLKWRALRP